MKAGVKAGVVIVGVKPVVVHVFFVWRGGGAVLRGVRGGAGALPIPFAPMGAGIVDSPR